MLKGNKIVSNVKTFTMLRHSVDTSFAVCLLACCNAKMMIFLRFTQAFTELPGVRVRMSTCLATLLPNYSLSYMIELNWNSEKSTSCAQCTLCVYSTSIYAVATMKNGLKSTMWHHYSH